MTNTEEVNTPRAAMHQTGRTNQRIAPHVGDHTPVRKRSRKATVSEDIFYIPLDEIPEGLNYEWKRWENVGKEDPFYIASMRQQGWEPVSPKMHPNWVPPGYREPHIIKGGQILMERPMELTLEARRELRAMSKQQVIEAEQRLGMTPNGQLTREHPDVAPKVDKGYFRPMNVQAEVD